MNSYKHLDVFMQGRKVGTLAVTPERTVAFAYDRKWLNSFPRPQRIFHHIKLIGVHHGGLPVGVFALEIPVIVGVDMAVEEKFWLVFFHQSAEYGKALMRKIGKVVKP